jgi:hypothetical protein
VETVEHNKKDTHARWESENPLCRKAIGLQLSILEGSDRILLSLVISIKRSQVEV